MPHQSPAGDAVLHLRSAASEEIWPSLPDAASAPLLAMLYQLERTQWWTPAQLGERQLLQISAVLKHARDSVPFYRQGIAASAFDCAAPEEAAFSRLPLLTRADIQQAGKALHSTRVLPVSGATVESKTSGSTGLPIRVLTTALCGFYWQALTLRDHLWHGRDFGGRLAAIRLKVSEGEWPNWGGAVERTMRSGPSATLDIHHDVAAQLAWVQTHDPDYLLTFPSNLEALALHALATGTRLPALREVRTVAEMLPPGLRELVREAWNVPLVDIYSAQEVGYIALQCPGHEHYHVQSESVRVEILRDDGTPCAPGEVGKVVITALHNFAMPLIRYDIGDRAEAGAPCACGRGLPVIRRVLGRVRNMVRLPGGRSHWPSLAPLSAMSEGLIRQFQCVQRDLERIEVRVVAARALTSGEEAGLRAAMQEKLGHPFTVDIIYAESIARGSGGKFEEFRCEIADG